MGKIVELIKSFINPVEPEKSFDEIAVAAGVSSEDMVILKKSMGGVDWKFDEGYEESKKTKKAKLSSNEPSIKLEQKTIVEERKKGFDRED